jgi:hypothetical protein
VTAVGVVPGGTTATSTPAMVVGTPVASVAVAVMLAYLAATFGSLCMSSPPGT